MSVSRHPSGPLIAAYATGQLPLAASVTIAAHLETCGACRLRVRVLEHIEGELLAETPPAALVAGELDNALARLDTTSPSVDPIINAAPAILADIKLPRTLQRLGLGSRRWIGPGFWTAPVRAPVAEGWRAFLLRVPNGARIPMHRHGGGELIAVLSGEFHDGQTYRAGDFAENAEGGSHELTVADASPCACLISIQGRTRWRGWSRLVAKALDV